MKQVASNWIQIYFHFVAILLVIVLVFLSSVSIAEADSDNIENIIKPGTILEGTLTQFNLGSYTNYNYSMTIIITDVEGTEFKGTMDHQSLDFHNIAKIKGTISPSLNKVWFTPYEKIASSNGLQDTG